MRSQPLSPSVDFTFLGYATCAHRCRSTFLSGDIAVLMLLTKRARRTHLARPTASPRLPGGQRETVSSNESADPVQNLLVVGQPTPWVSRRLEARNLTTLPRRWPGHSRLASLIVVGEA